ncbi:MAG: P-loop NTPase [Ignavibacteria bacterium]|nr:P-loop NTPase [Ignavibacteria bacterium]
MKIAIASGKGGTGKTTVATNLASFFSDSSKIVLADLDVEEPNSKLFFTGDLQLKENKFKYIPNWDKEKCVICNVCSSSCNFHAIIRLSTEILVFPELCHSCYACSELCPKEALPMVPSQIGILNHYKNSKYDLVESRLQIGEEQAVPLIAQTKQYVEKHFKNDVLKIFDSPPGTSCPAIESIKDVDFVILVSEPTPFGLNDLKLAVETVRELEKDFAVVINRFGIGNEQIMNFCANEDIDIIAKIPHIREAAVSYSKGELLIDKFPELRTEIELISEYIFSYKERAGL